MEVIDISPAEWQIMRIIWTLDDATSKQITEILQTTKNWQPSTVKTLLGRLVKKGYLKTEKQGRHFIYEPLVDESNAVADEGTNLLRNICAKRDGALIKELVTNAQLSQSDIKELSQMLLQKAKDAPETVACNCLPEEMGGSCD